MTKREEKQRKAARRLAEAELRLLRLKRAAHTDAAAALAAKLIAEAEKRLEQLRRQASQLAVSSQMLTEQRHLANVRGLFEYGPLGTFIEALHIYESEEAGELYRSDQVTFTAASLEVQWLLLRAHLRKHPDPKLVTLLAAMLARIQEELFVEWVPRVTLDTK